MKLPIYEARFIDTQAIKEKFKHWDKNRKAAYLRFLDSDPSLIYTESLISKIDPYKRIQSMAVADMFPILEPGKCVCGCGQNIRKGGRRYASQECMYYINYVFEIIYGRTDSIGRYLEIVNGLICNKCKKTRLDGWEVDHIIPVGLGGGGSWVNNYQILCHECHVEKTTTDTAAIKEFWAESKKTI